MESVRHTQLAALNVKEEQFEGQNMTRMLELSGFMDGLVPNMRVTALQFGVANTLLDRLIADHGYDLGRLVTHDLRLSNTESGGPELCMTIEVGSFEATLYGYPLVSVSID